jgi:hypothetical protein
VKENIRSSEFLRLFHDFLASYQVYTAEREKGKDRVREKREDLCRIKKK